MYKRKFSTKKLNIKTNEGIFYEIKREIYTYNWVSFENPTTKASLAVD